MATGKLMDLEQWRRARFAGDPPSETTIRRWCREGHVPAKKIAGTWFIDLDAERRQTGNELADQVLGTMGV
ncbi:helix-turn-helix domain-containing protein [Chromohalobacter nigrandesensis]|uniref:helix-turn-helix domain-containing protein n=1 Tax=Chromohalobacter nigrandesensis TaxID=119863 RepID=UPI001FF41127|nr:helix-turn-helix domain-containing protein [Chromohalobacter nigrandesensis]MCK0743602.1 helix-turn-helix domain-containing protein [Chromohalobacter nigrandesensis]